MRDIVIFSDPGRDLDDEVMFLLASQAKKKKLIGDIHVVTTTYPSTKRAKLAKSTFNSLNCESFVYFGSDSAKNLRGSNEEFSIEYYDESAEILSIDKLLDIDLTLPIDIFVVAACTDCLSFLQQRALHEDSVIYMMGGIDGYLQPDDSFNWTSDMDSAKKLFELIKQKEISSVFLTRWATYQHPMKKKDFEIVSNFEVGKSIISRQEKSLEHLWKTSHIPLGDPERKNMPDRINPDWFKKTFGDDNFDENNVKSSIRKFMMYDPFTLLCCLYPYDSIRENQTNHIEIVGKTEKSPSFSISPVKRFMELMNDT